MVCVIIGKMTRKDDGVYDVTLERSLNENDDNVIPSGKM